MVDQQKVIPMITGIIILTLATFFLVLGSMTNALATPKIQQFDEFLADNLAKKSIPDYILKRIEYVSGEISVRAKYIAISTGQEGFEKGAFDIMAQEVALAKLYDPGKYAFFEKALKNSVMLDKGPKILELSEEYIKNADYLSPSENAINIIAEKTAQLRGTI